MYEVYLHIVKRLHVSTWDISSAYVNYYGLESLEIYLNKKKIHKNNLLTWNIFLYRYYLCFFRSSHTNW